MTAKYDELNELGAISIEDYFDEMDLTDKQKEDRKGFAEEMEDAMLFILALVAVMSRYNAINEEFISQQIKERYLAVAGRYGGIDGYIQDYVGRFAEETVQTTLDHIGEDYYLSDERATFIACNEANTTLNYSDWKEAVESGKTKKQWVTMKDRRVRDTHREVDGQIIGINEPFLVGDSLLFYPKDFTFDPSPEETVNCRCSIRYI